jgi:N-methylhydantoinase B
MRAAIAEAPNGVYEGEAWIDSDGIDDEPLPIRAKVTIRDDSVEVDFTGTGPQVRGNMNCPFASTVASATTCVKSVLTSADIPYNGGSAKPITVTAPFGSILNPRPPAAVRARMTASNRAHNAVMHALAKAVPGRVIANGFDTTTGPYLSHVGPTGYRVYHEIIGGGWGASAGADGCSGSAEPMANCTNAPVETLDMDFDFFRVVEYGLIPNSGGNGKYRGGLGVCRTYEILRDGVSYAQYGDRFVTEPQGLFGGEPGARASVTLRRNNENIVLKSKDARELRKGDILTVRTGGGGGYGDPTRRDPRLTDLDKVEGFVTSEQRRAHQAAPRQSAGAP